MTAEEESFPRSTSSKPRRRNRARGGSKPSESSALNKDKKRSETSKEAKITKKVPSDSTDKDAPVENKKAQTSISSSNEKKKKKQKKGRGKKNSIPKPGEEGYMTPTQLRNARKRRAKERGKSNDDDNDNEKNSNDEAESLNEIIVVDPPRKGLDDAVRKALTDDLASSSKDGPQLLVYVSCGFNAFERDCNVLLESGKWAIDHAEGHLLFPGSDAIETLAFFVRK
mmetsp:Transcript_15362/g.22046  ORF Transcript_15362/g.22046 Transcript_15362/m.22046 type:complete len:226 (+) Transcript_15362:45-722(+)